MSSPMLLYTHSACLKHLPGPGHPESPARLQAVLEALDNDRFAMLDRIEAPRATREQLARVHGAVLIECIVRERAARRLRASRCRHD